MKTSRLFTGDIYYNGVIKEQDVLLVYFPRKGFVKAQCIDSLIDILIMRMTSKFDKLFMGTNLSIYKSYVDKSSLRVFDYDNVQMFKDIKLEHLKLMDDDYKKKMKRC